MQDVRLLLKDFIIVTIQEETAWGREWGGWKGKFLSLWNRIMKNKN